MDKVTQASAVAVADAASMATQWQLFDEYRRRGSLRRAVLSASFREIRVAKAREAPEGEKGVVPVGKPRPYYGDLLSGLTSQCRRGVDLLRLRRGLTHMERQLSTKHSLQALLQFAAGQQQEQQEEEDGAARARQEDMTAKELWKFQCDLLEGIRLDR